MDHREYELRLLDKQLAYVEAERLSPSTAREMRERVIELSERPDLPDLICWVLDGSYGAGAHYRVRQWHDMEAESKRPNWRRLAIMVFSLLASLEAQSKADQTRKAIVQHYSKADMEALNARIAETIRAHYAEQEATA